MLADLSIVRQPAASSVGPGQLNDNLGISDQIVDSGVRGKHRHEGQIAVDPSQRVGDLAEARPGASGGRNCPQIPQLRHQCYIVVQQLLKINKLALKYLLYCSTRYRGQGRSQNQWGSSGCGSSSASQAGEGSGREEAERPVERPEPDPPTVGMTPGSGAARSNTPEWAAERPTKRGKGGE